MINKKVIIILIIIALPFTWAVSIFIETIISLKQTEKPSIVKSICQEEIGDKNQFAVSDIYKGKIKDIDFNSFPNSDAFKAQIEKGYEEGVNFAGHFNVSSWSCGAGCQSHSIIDVKTGEIIAHDLNSELGAFYTPNSSLFIINPQENTPNPADQNLLSYLKLTQRKYYKIKNNSLDLLCEESADSGIGAI